MRHWPSWMLWSGLAGLVAAVAWWVGHGAGGLSYLAYYVLVVAPGWPIGWALFGRRQPAAWIAGSLVGYALTTLVWWVPVVSGAPTRTGFVIAWLALAVVTRTAAARVRSPLIVLPPWGLRETAALVLVLALVPVLVGAPFANVGRQDAQGNRYYRAYFTADFVWHTALTAELARLEWPPRNPYLASQPVHYYWTYMLVPAIASARGPAPLRDVQRALKINALASGLLFFGAMFVTAWVAVPRAGAVGGAMVLTTLASSAEGLYAVWDALTKGVPLSWLTQLNIDAISTWFFHGLRVDGLQRALWYTPQHSMAGALGLVGLAVAASGGLAADPRAIAIAGVALGGATAFNPFVGGIFSLGYGVAIAANWARRREHPSLLLWHAAAAVPVAVALGWAVLNRMLTGAGGTLHFGFSGPATMSPVGTLLLSLGPVLIPAVLGLWPRRRLPFAAAAPGAATAAFGLFFAYTLVLQLDLFWVGFRGTQIFLVAVPVLVARFFVQDGRSRSARRLVLATGTLLVLIGLPTILVDAYNAQDITNRAMGPGFRWTVPVTPDEHAALTWLRRYTRPDAVVCMEPTARGRDTWSLIPSFAERRMPAGLPISLLKTPEYEAQTAVVRRIYETTDAREAWRLARQLGIDYIYMDNAERLSYPGAALDKFGLRPDLFTPVFYNVEAAVFAVRAAPAEIRG